MTKGWKQIYPQDCYRALMKISAETGVSFPKVVNIIVREGLIYSPKLPDKWKLPEYTSLTRLLVETPFVKPKPKPKLSMEEQKHLKYIEHQLSIILELWHSFDRKTKRHHVATAKEYLGRVPNAKLVLALADGEQFTNPLTSSVSKKPRDDGE